MLIEEVQYRNMTIEELVSNWEVDDSHPTYKDTLIQKLLEKLTEVEDRVDKAEKEVIYWCENYQELQEFLV